MKTIPAHVIRSGLQKVNVFRFFAELSDKVELEMSCLSELRSCRGMLIDLVEARLDSGAEVDEDRCQNYVEPARFGERMVAFCPNGRPETRLWAREARLV
jgi:hypothetical protein